MIKYCRKCGSKLVAEKLYEKFDPETGKPRYFLACPNSFKFFAFGHDSSEYHKHFEEEEVKSLIKETK